MGTIKTTNIETITGSGTLTLGQSGETISIPTNTTLGASGSTITIPSGCTITNNGTQTGFGGANTPNFYATRSTSQSIPSSTFTTIIYTNETFDSDSLYDTSTGRFTVTASTTGYYSFSAAWRTLNWTTSRQAMVLRKNGTDVIWGETGLVGPYATMSANMIINLASSGDYVEAIAYHEFGSTKDFGTGNNIGNFYGFKLI